MKRKRKEQPNRMLWIVSLLVVGSMICGMLVTLLPSSPAPPPAQQEPSATVVPSVPASPTPEVTASPTPTATPVSP